MSDDGIMARITASIERLHAGDREGARQDFAGIWADLGAEPDPFHVCTLSHYMADAQDDVREELAWDLRALDAAAEITDGRAKAHHASLSIKSFYPSLHLNVGDAYYRLGDFEHARQHLDAARATLQDLPTSPLADMTRGGVTGLAQRLEAADPDATAPETLRP